MANGHDNVGRYLLTQANQDVWGVTEQPVLPYRGPQQTSGLQEWRDGAFRREHAAFGTSFMNSGWAGNADATISAKTAIAEGLKGRALVAALNAEIACHLRLNASAETLPDKDNRVTLDTQRDGVGIPRPRVAFTIGDYTKRGLDVAFDINERLLRLMGEDEPDTDGVYLSNAIIAGTTRMGRRPETSVVDADLRCHEHPNLFICGPSTHVTAPVNAPSLTVTALAYRLAEKLIGEHRK